MKHFLLYTILLASASILFSCSLAHFLTVNDQKPETKKEYQKYLSSLKADTAYSYQLAPNYYDSMSVLPYAINTYKLKHNAKASPVQIRVYNKKGELVNAYEQCFGEIRKLGILDSFPMKKIAHLPINYNVTLTNDLNLFADKETRNNLLVASAKKEYTFIVFYALWTGYYSSNPIKKLPHHFKGKESEILLIYVNTSPVLNNKAN